jgi:hypothetical protein
MFSSAAHRQEKIMAASKKTGARFLYEATVCGSAWFLWIDFYFWFGLKISGENHGKPV